MGNQINAGDQNTQQLGQNQIEQPTPTLVQEKPKRNYWIISIIAGFFLLVGLVTFYFYSSVGRKQTPSIGVNPTPTTQLTPSLASDRSLNERTIIYSVQKEQESASLALFAIKLDGKEKTQLLEYQNNHDFYANIPKIVKTSTLVYLDGKNKLFIVDGNRDKKLLAEPTAGNEIKDFVISEDGTIVIYQEFNNPEPGLSCKNFSLRSVNTVSGEKRILYTNISNYFKPIKISNDKTKVFVIGGLLEGGIGSCYGAANILQTIDLTTKAISTIKTFSINRGEAATIELQSGFLFSPDEKYGAIAYSTNPASPLISTPSRQYPVKMAILDLSNGIETTLTESFDRYIFPVDWYSNSKSVLYWEQAPNTVENYQNIKDNYKKIDIQTKQITPLFTLERRAKGMEYSQILDDSLMIYTARSEQDWLEGTSLGTSLMRVNLDGSNKVELDKQVRFLYLVGIY